MNEWSKTIFGPALAVGSIALTLGPAARAQNVDFSAVNLATVSSTSGQNFGTIGGTIVNVRLISGTPSVLEAGMSPDPTGFYALQSVSALNPFTFLFTLSTPQVFQINQNETVTGFETNAFGLPSGAWTVLSSSNVTQTTTGSNVSFTGTLNTAPYGTYAIQGSGSSFNFTVNNAAGLGSTGSYGSAISLRLTGGVSTAAPEPSSIALVLMAASAAGASGLRIGNRRLPIK